MKPAGHCHKASFQNVAHASDHQLNIWQSLLQHGQIYQLSMADCNSVLSKTAASSFKVTNPVC